MTEEEIRVALHTIARREPGRVLIQEETLYRALRTLPEESRFALIREMYTLSPYPALRFVHHCLVKPGHLEFFLRDGLTWADASNNKYFLRATIPRLGWKNTRMILLDMLDTCPDGVYYADYWLTRDVAQWFSRDLGTVRQELNLLRQDHRFQAIHKRIEDHRKAQKIGNSL